MPTTEIVLCSTCKGEGVLHQSECVNQHKRDYATWTDECQNCGGSGRLEKTTTITFAPFKAEPADPTRRV